jgi:hypothetical protein
LTGASRRRTMTLRRSTPGQLHSGEGGGGGGRCVVGARGRTGQVALQVCALFWQVAGGVAGN